MKPSVLSTPDDPNSTKRGTVTQQIVFEIEQRGDVYIIRIGGRLATGANIDLLQTKAQTIKSLGCTKLIADICELDSIGSEGIAFFVDLYKSTTKDIAGRFVLASPSPRVLEVLTLTGLSTIIPFVNDLAAALTYCAREENKTHQAASSLG